MYTHLYTATASERALKIIEEKRLTHTPEQKCWAVTGSTGKVYTVVLFRNGTWDPNCSCTCSAICCHIMAVFESVGCERTASSRIPVVLDMMRNQQKKNNKKLGGKASLKAPGPQRKKRKFDDDELTEFQENLLAEEDAIIEHEKGNAFSNLQSPTPFAPHSVKKPSTIPQPTIRLPFLKNKPVLVMTAFPNKTIFVNKLPDSSFEHPKVKNVFYANSPLNVKSTKPGEEQNEQKPNEESSTVNNITTSPEVYHIPQRQTRETDYGEPASETNVSYNTNISGFYNFVMDN